MNGRFTQTGLFPITQGAISLSSISGNDGSTGDAVLYNYGFLGTYGVGFGFPLLLGLPEARLDCGYNDF